MPKRKSPQNRILEYFDGAAIEEAVNTLAVCQWIVSKRQGTTAKPRAVRKPRTIQDGEVRAANG